MSVDPDLLHERFSKLADQVGPGGRVDVDRARADGRRALARRRHTTSGAAISAMALTVAVALFFAGGLPEGRRAATPAPVASPTASESFPHTSDDPVAVGLSFGWLPSGLYTHTPSWPSTTNVTQSYLMAEADSEADSGADSGADVGAAPVSASPGILERELTLYTAPPGPMPRPLGMQFGVQSESEVAGPLIGGSPSWFETPRVGYFGAEGLGVVVWRLSDGDWAVLTYRDNSHNGQGSGLFSRANVIRIAQSVTEKPDPVAVPFFITGALAQADVTAVQSSSTNGTNGYQPDYWLTLTFREAGAEIDVTFRVGEGQLAVLPGQACGPTAAQAGVMACVTVHGTLPPTLARGGLSSLLDDIILLGRGTTNVIQ